MSAEIQHFFELLYPGVQDGWLVISWPDPYTLTAQGTHPLVSQWVNPHTHPWTEVAGAVQAFAQTRDLYFGVALQHPDCAPARTRRGRNASAYVLPGLWADIDLATGQHTAGALPQTQAEALDFLSTLEQSPSLLIDTGGGLHGYWLFARPVVLTSIEALASMAQLSRRFARFLIAQGKAHDWTLDNVGDLARTLRPPGTINHKYGTTVTIVHEGGARYTPESFAWLPTLPPPAGHAPDQSRLVGLPDLVQVAEAYGAVLHEKTPTELAGAHPIHGSSTGTNFNVSSAKQLWCCRRHGSGGDALTLIAVCEGWLPCDDARSGSLRGALFPRVATYANTHLGATIVLQSDTPPWTPGIVHHVLPAHIRNHPDPHVRTHWQRIYRRTAILKEAYAREGGVLCPK
jgi:hypothetical protein